jgi:hypothetical protein
MGIFLIFTFRGIIWIFLQEYIIIIYILNLFAASPNILINGQISTIKQGCDWNVITFVGKTAKKNL